MSADRAVTLDELAAELGVEVASVLPDGIRLTIPDAMVAAERWLAWRPIDGKKCPIDEDGRPLKAWRSCALSFVEATRRAARWPDAERGFLLGDGWGGIDLDNCRDPKTGELDLRAAALLESCPGYKEVSPSGEGVKCFGRVADGSWLELNFRDPERMTAARKPPGFFAVTGHVIERGDVTADLGPAIETALGFFGGATEAEPGPRRLPEAIPAGTQNDALFHEGCRHRAQGKSEDEVFHILLALRHRCDPVPSEADVRAVAHSACRYPEGDPFPLTELGDAECFAALFSDRLRFDLRRERWLEFDGTRWAPRSAVEMEHRAGEAIRLRQSAATGNKERLKWAVLGESRRRLTNLVALARGVAPLMDRGDGWDTDAWLLGVPNGVVDLKSGTARLGQPGDRITMQAAVAFDPEAGCPLWERTLAEIFPDPAKLSFVHRALGYSITGDCREEVFFLLTGALDDTQKNGGNGKGTVVNTVAWVLGDYSDNLAFSSLEQSPHGPKDATNDLAKLVGKRLVTAAESNGGRFDTARLKALTGRDPITARFLHREFFTFVPDLKLWLSANRLPRVRDDSAGFWRRTRVVEFTECFMGKEDMERKDRLRAEWPGILAWLVKGCLAWQREGLNPPAAVTGAVAQYREQEDPLADFYESGWLVFGDDVKVKSSDLHDAYLRWARFQRRGVPLGPKTFSQAVSRRFGQPRDTTVNGISGRYFFGVGVAQDGGGL